MFIFTNIPMPNLARENWGKLVARDKIGKIFKLLHIFKNN